MMYVQKNTPDISIHLRRLQSRKRSCKLTVEMGKNIIFRGTKRITWQRGGGRLGAGGAQQLHVSGMKPASLPLLSPSLDEEERSLSNAVWILKKYIK